MELISISATLHLFATIIWIGGMFFAYQILRPVAVSQLEPPQRLKLLTAVFKRFFPFVWLSVILLPLTGYYMMTKMWGGFSTAPMHIYIMTIIGSVMILIYLHIFFAPYKQLTQAVSTQDWPTAGKKLNQIRILIAVNLSLGIIVISVAAYNH